jgi:hypothetical protein
MSYEVVRWPFAASGADLTFYFRRVNSVLITNSQAIAAGTYICDGSSSVIAPIDMVKAFRDAAQAAATAIATVGGTVTATLGTNGNLTMTHTGESNAMEVYNLTATQRAWLGADSSSVEIGNGTNWKWQMFGQWHPQIDTDYDSGDLQRQIVSEGRNLKGEPRRVVRSYAPWTERILEWSRVPGGAMSAARAADATFAAVAGILQNEDNTWEALWRYLTGTPGPYSDNRIYLYSTNDPTTDTREGPYDIILTDSEPGLDGLPAGGYVKSMSSEYYPVKMLLREIA